MSGFGKRATGSTSSPSPAASAPSEEKAAPIASTGPGTSLVSLEEKHLPSLMAKFAGAEAAPRAAYTDPKLETADYQRAKRALIDSLLDHLDFAKLDSYALPVRKTKIRELADEFMGEVPVPLNAAQQALLKEHVVDEVLGLGPLEPLLADPDVADIMVNTHKQVYIEKQGKIFLTDITFTSEKHLINVIQRIVTAVGRRIDENSPMVDARMPDGSRFNAVIPPLALDGGLVSIRKFKKNKMPLTAYVEIDSMSAGMAKFLEICSAIRLNMIVSGGTGSGKTTLLNALSGHIDVGERVVTIEDAAELQMHQPHVLRLETRPANSEGLGEVNQRQLVRNALRMRPDRIILGEIRGDEVIDVLSAMNTGHDGSMATIHSNSPRDCLTRIENLVGMSGVSVPHQSLRHQIASAIQLIIQIARMRDGRRRITHIEEIVGIEGDIISTQTLFEYKPGPMSESGTMFGEFTSHNIRPRFLQQAAYYGRDKELLECLRPGL